MQYVRVNVWRRPGRFLTACSNGKRQGSSGSGQAQRVTQEASLCHWVLVWRQVHMWCLRFTAAHSDGICVAGTQFQRGRGALQRAAANQRRLGGGALLEPSCRVGDKHRLRAGKARLTCICRGRAAASSSRRPEHRRLIAVWTNVPWARCHLHHVSHDAVYGDTGARGQLRREELRRCCTARRSSIN